ncbi:MAG: hypothetical protein JWR69_2659 [Pedosphaera sp.]|nr:hypothetical protein [Pedosphaera sp.]
MPAREVEICKRLRIYRIRTGLSQIAFARDVGLDSTKLASFEHARAPLRYDVAYKILSTSLLNPQWLAEGIWPISSTAFFYNAKDLKAEPGALFSKVYDSLLKPRLEAEISEEKKNSESGNMHYTPDPKGRVIAEAVLKDCLGEWLELVQDDRLNEFGNKLYSFANEFIYAEELDSPKIIQARKRDMEAARIYFAEQHRKLRKR